MKKCAKLTLEQQQELQGFISQTKNGAEIRRAQAVLLLDRGASLEMLYAITRFKRRQVFKYRKAYLAQGLEGVTDKRKGKVKRLLSKPEREEVVEIFSNKTPQDFGYGMAYWTTGLAGRFIKERYDVHYSSKTCNSGFSLDYIKLSLTHAQ